MSLTEDQVKRLLEYNGSMQFSQLGLSLVITRLRSRYRSNYNTTALLSCTRELNDFLGKFGAVLKKDYEWIVNL